MGDQAAGRIGTQWRDAPFRHLREVFQTLEGTLPGDLLGVEHVRSHTGDPFNEMVDLLAKQEAQSSLFLHRQRIDMNVFKACLRHLWMTVEGQSDLPPLTKEGFDVAFHSLPQVQHKCSASPLSSSVPQKTTFAVS